MYLTQGLHRAAQQRANDTAFVFGERRRTYAELRERVARFAGALQKLGVQPGDRVAKLAINSDRYLEYYLGVFWASGVVNPINIRWSAREIIYSLEDCDSSVLLVDDAYRALAQELRAGTSILRHVIYVGDGPTPEGMLSYEDLLSDSPPVEDACRRGDDLAGIFYTGGTTGFPKGVMLSHTNLGVPALSLLASDFPPGRVYLHATPMFHGATLMFMLAQLMSANRHVTVPTFDPVKVMDTIAAQSVTDIFLVPAMVQMLVDHPQRSKFDLSGLQRIWYGGSPIAEAILDRAMAALPGTGFVQLYGLTEVPVTSLLSPYHHTYEGRQGGRIQSAGHAARGSEVRIVDGEGREVPPRTIGEIAVRGPNVMLGYWNKPKETQAAIRNGWVHTGDGGQMTEDGFIHIVDRLKDMIVSGGENVYAAEVENAVAKHPGVASCAVIGIPDEQWGEAVHAVIVLKRGAPKVTSEEIREHCKKLIAGYKSPRSIELRDSLPLSGAGKVLKTELRAPYWAGRSRKI